MRHDNWPKKIHFVLSNIPIFFLWQVLASCLKSITFWSIHIDFPIARTKSLLFWLLKSKTWEESIMWIIYLFLASVKVLTYQYLLYCPKAYLVLWFKSKIFSTGPHFVLYPDCIYVIYRKFINFFYLLFLFLW